MTKEGENGCDFFESLLDFGRPKIFEFYNPYSLRDHKTKFKAVC